LGQVRLKTKPLNKFQNIVIVIGILIAILLFNKTKPVLLKVVLIGIVCSIGLPLLYSEIIIINITFWVFGLLTLTYTYYNGLNKTWLNFIVGIFAFASFLFGILDLPFYNVLLFTMIFPLTCYLLIIKDWKRHINQLAILTILAFYELNLILNIIEL
jgi:hypothetical protein